jgi:hypothetical protein
MRRSKPPGSIPAGPSPTFVLDEPYSGAPVLARYTVIISRRGYRKLVMFQGHRVQHATIGVAKIHPGWLVIDVKEVGRRTRGEHRSTSVKPGWRRSAGNGTSAVVVPHRLPVRLIPDPEQVTLFRAEIDQRQLIRIEAGLPRLDAEAELARILHQYAEDDYRRRLDRYLTLALSVSAPAPGMVPTMRRHRDAMRHAQELLHRVEGLPAWSQTPG